VGLGLVLNVPQIPEAEKNRPGGVPTLGANGKIPPEQIPETNTSSFGVFRFFIPQTGPLRNHLVLRHPAAGAPPAIFIDKTPGSPTRGHLLWVTDDAGMVDLGSVDTPTFELEQKIGDLAALTTADKSSLVGAVNEVNGKV
jgi:hypothetical protein